MHEINFDSSDQYLFINYLLVKSIWVNYYNQANNIGENMKKSLPKIAELYGISKQALYKKSPAMQEQIRAFVEAGGNKAAEDALSDLSRWCYRLSIARSLRVTLDIKRYTFEVIIGSSVAINRNLDSKSILLAMSEIANLVKTAD